MVATHAFQTWPDLTEPTVPDIAKFETQPETEAIFFYFQQQNYINI